MSSLIPFNQRRPSAFSSVFFNNMCDTFFPEGAARQARAFCIDIEETDDAYAVTADLPGISKDEISIRMLNGRLIVAVNKKEEQEQREKNYVHRERFMRSYTRSLYLPGTDADAVKAKLEDGVLTIAVGKKKKEAEESRPIEIE
ncbi:MAG: Hsp20/alpha crystallin family protein [Eubacteriaceae bacterium]|jgi:HSP20 family protein|nr:Hsp20/alpha crystallin family protein [Eubacteriaceae bacterium]